MSVGDPSSPRNEPENIERRILFCKNEARIILKNTYIFKLVLTLSITRVNVPGVSTAGLLPEGGQAGEEVAPPDLLAKTHPLHRLCSLHNRLLVNA